MKRRRPLLIHRNEWERIKNEANPETQHKSHSHIHIEAMNEQSQKWISQWPDSVQGVVNKLAMNEEKKRLAEKAEIEEFRSRKKPDNTAALKKARKMIFERTGYGKELLSLLFQSKVYDEREIQIKYRNEILEKEKKSEEEKLEVENIMYARFEKGESNRLLQEQIQKANAAYNKAVADMKREDDLKAAAIEEKNRHEEAELIEKFNQLQLQSEKPDYCLDKEGFKLYEQQNKAIKEMRETREKLDQKLADVYCKYRDRVRRREKQVLDQIHKEKHNTRGYQGNYEMVRRIQNEKEKIYNDFVNKGIKRKEKRLQAMEEGHALKDKEQRRRKTAQAQILAESQETIENKQKKCCCDKQSFLPSRRGKQEATLIEMKETPSRRPPCFLAPSTALQQALKERKAEPSGWTGTAGAHKQFEEYASEVLAEATHKHLVRKVIDSYCKTNNIKDLQVPGY